MFSQRSQSLVSVLVFFLLQALASASDCPDCYFNQSPFDSNHVAAEDGSGRRQITIRIETSGDYSWGEQTNFRIWNATETARTEWNTATDGYGHTTGYYFKLDQSATNPDFIIRRQSTESRLCRGLTLWAALHYLPAIQRKFVK